MSKWEGLPSAPGRRLLEPNRPSGRRYLLVAVLGLLAVVAVFGKPLPDIEGVIPTATPSPTAARVAAARPVIAVPTAFPTAVPTAAPSATPSPQVLVVANTGGVGVYIRRSTNLTDRIKAWPERTVMLVVGPDQDVQGRKWRNVKDPNGNVGWIPAEYLAAPSPTPTPSGAATRPVPTPASTGPVRP